MTTKYLSEIISNEEISTWKPGDELQKMTSEESVSNQIGKVKEEKENR